jgi:hypothetical protein
MAHLVITGSQARGPESANRLAVPTAHAQKRKFAANWCRRADRLFGVVNLQGANKRRRAAPKAERRPDPARAIMNSFLGGGNPCCALGAGPDNELSRSIV